MTSDMSQNFPENPRLQQCCKNEKNDKKINN